MDQFKVSLYSSSRLSRLCLRLTFPVPGILLYTRQTLYLLCQGMTGERKLSGKCVRTVPFTDSLHSTFLSSSALSLRRKVAILYFISVFSPFSFLLGHSIPLFHVHIIEICSNISHLNLLHKTFFSFSKLCLKFK